MVQLVIPFGRGGVPNLTPAQVESMVTSTSSDKDTGVIFSFSVFDAHNAAKACTSLNTSYTALCGYKDSARYRSIMTIRQAWVGAHSITTSENSVGGESEAGRVVLDMKALVKAVSNFKPTWCMPLYSAHPMDEVNHQQPTKKHRAAVARTVKWYEGATGVDAATALPKGSVAVPSSVVTSSSADAAIASGTCPFVFLDNAGQGESLGARTSAMLSVAAAAPGQGTFVIAESIPAILLAALGGATMVECDYGTACARRGQAIDLMPLVAVLRGDDAPIDTAAPFTFIIDLNDQQYQLDTTPFAANSSAVGAHTCPCYSCRRHTKAYVYHLLSVQEMNAETLLTIHNVSQVMVLCDSIRSAMSMGPAESKARLQKALALLAPQH